MIDFYTAATPNGYKIAIFLEESGLEYTPHFLQLGERDQKKPEFLKINPNGRIPAIVDRDEDNLAVFESGAILLYLADKTGQFIPADTAGRARTLSWLMWQMGGLGPMMGQANVFTRYLEERIPTAIERYQNESYRLFSVMEEQLDKTPYLAGDEYSIADMASWPWVAIYKWPGLSLDNYPMLTDWHNRIMAREAVQRALQVPPREINPEDEEEAGKFAGRVRGILA